MNIATFNHRQAEEILNSKKETLDEVREVVIELSQWDHNQIKDDLKQKGWETEELISVRPLEKKWRFDAYKNKVAIEIEGSTCYRSFLKFILGYNEGKINVGILITKNGQQSTRGHPMSVAKRELKDFRTIIPVPIYLLGLSV